MFAQSSTEIDLKEYLGISVSPRFSISKVVFLTIRTPSLLPFSLQRGKQNDSSQHMVLHTLQPPKCRFCLSAQNSFLLSLSYQRNSTEYQYEVHILLNFHFIKYQSFANLQSSKLFHKHKLFLVTSSRQLSNFKLQNQFKVVHKGERTITKSWQQICCLNENTFKTTLGP